MWGGEYNPLYALVWLIVFMIAIRLVVKWFCWKMDRELQERIDEERRNNE